jgi:hypothetical protein
MKLFRILAIAALAMVSSASAQAGAITGVVLSNMGADGDTFPTSGSSHNVSSSGLSRLAVAITGEDCSRLQNELNCCVYRRIFFRLA